MNRRRFLAAVATPLASGLMLPKLAANDRSPRSIVPKWRYFFVTTSITLPDIAGPAQLWVPVAQTAGGYQLSLSIYSEGAGQTEWVHDSRYGTPVLRTNWSGEDRANRWFNARQIVAVRDRRGGWPDEPSSGLPLDPLTEAERKFWIAPTASAPLDGVVLATATKITAGKNTPRERLRAIYDWVIDHTHRDPDVPGCGRGDIKGMLESGKLGGKCADINGLLVGLARAAGFPARDVYGIRVAPSKLFPSLGAGGDISKAQHCRAEVFLDGEGWFPVDPADVCKAILMEKLAPDSPEVRELRDRLFGQWETNWIGYNSATDIELPGVDGKTHRPDFSFLMYPCAVTPEGELSCTDPEKFRYEITVREFTG